MRTQHHHRRKCCNSALLLLMMVVLVVQSTFLMLHFDASSPRGDGGFRNNKIDYYTPTKHQEDQQTHLLAEESASLVAAVSSSPIDMHKVVPGQYGEFGFFYISIGDSGDADSGLFCDQLKNSTLALRKSRPKCFAKKRCSVALIGDAQGTSRVRRDCPKPFAHILERNISGCMEETDVRARKLCIRQWPLPFSYNIFLDADTRPVGPGLEQIFDVLLAGFEYAATWECCARRKGNRAVHRLALPHEALLSGWELQTGVLGLANTEAVRRHAARSISITVEKQTQHASLTFKSAEQSFETLALASSDLRVFTLPPNFNMRYFTTDGFEKVPIHLLHEKNQEEIQRLAKKYDFTVK